MRRSAVVPLVALMSGTFLAGAATAQEGGGSVVKGSVPSETVGGVVDYQVYLPEGYETDAERRFPTIYLLHGRGDTMEAWTQVKADLDALIASGEVPPVLAVMPDAPWSEAGNYVDSLYTGDDPGAFVETALTTDLLTHVDSTYRTLPDRSGRAVGGYSMGGYGALRYVLAHQDLFSAAIVLSPAVYVPLPPGDSSTREFGAFGVGETVFDDARYTELTYPALLESVDSERPVHVFLAVGDDECANPLPEDAIHDTGLETATAYDTLRRVPGVTAELRVLQGGPDRDVWRPAFIEGLKDNSSLLAAAPGASGSGGPAEAMDATLIGTPGDDWAGGVDTTADGDAIVALAASGSVLGAAAVGGMDVVVTRLGPDGTSRWTTSLASAGDERAYGVVARDDGGAYVAGYTNGELGSVEQPGSDDVFVASLGPDGAVQWVLQFGDPEEADRAYAIGRDPAGGVYIGGYTQGSIDGQVNAGDKDALVAHVTADGALDWVRMTGGEGEDKVFGVAEGPAGLAVVGATGATMPIRDVTNAGGLDAWAGLLDTAGTVGWIRQLGSDGDDLLMGAVQDAAGIHAVGTAGSVLAESSFGRTDAFTVTFDDAGIQTALFQWGTDEDDGAVVIDPVAEGYRVVGVTDCEMATEIGAFDIFVTTLSATDLAPSPALQVGTTADDGMDSLAEANLFAATGDDGALWISGVTYGSALNAANAGAADVFVHRLTP